MLSVKSLSAALAAGGTARRAKASLRSGAAHRRAPAPNDLKADVSFLASDALQGRGTPSPGLDLAAEYIAAQFRRAGLEPAGDDGYFQNANYQSVKPNPEGLEFTLGTPRRATGTVSIQEAVATDLHRVAAFKVMLSDAAALDALTAEQVRGKVLLVEVPDGGGAARRHGWISGATPDRDAGRQTGAGDGGDGARRGAAGNPNARVPMRDATAPAQTADPGGVGQGDPDAVAAAKPGPLDATVSAHVAPPVGARR